jgi:hypothetical protein
MKTFNAKDIRRMAESLKPFLGKGSNKVPVLAPGFRLRHETGIEYFIEEIIYSDDGKSVKKIILSNPLGELSEISPKHLSKYS